MENTINEMVRDFTTVVPRSKSEVRRRIEDLLTKQAEEFEKERWESTCSACGTHPSFWKTIVESNEWQEWEKIAGKRGFDYDESRDLGILSPKHFKAFLQFVAGELKK